MKNVEKASDTSRLSTNTREEFTRRDTKKQQMLQCKLKLQLAKCHENVIKNLKIKCICDVELFPVNGVEHLIALHAVRGIRDGLTRDDFETS